MQCAGGVVAAGLLLALYVHGARTLPPNSDEAQHLHVAWAWTQNLVPYRDVFDNHTPLFHWLFAPLLGLFGERADIIAVMRLTTWPIYVGTLLATGWIGRTLWSPRVGLCAAALLGAFPQFFVIAGQFRPDGLWALLWLAAIAAATTGAFSARRAFLAGLLLGAAFAVSLKTVLLAAAALVAAVSVWGLRFAAGDRSPPRNLRRLPLAFAGALLVPGAFALYFVAQGAAQSAVYCLFTHNALPELGRWDRSWLWVLFPLLYPASIAAVWLVRDRGDPARWWRRSWIWLTTSAYALLLYSYWPLITAQDRLPVLPLLALALGSWLFARRAPATARLYAIAAVVLVAACMAALSLRVLTPSKAMQATQAQLARVLALTRPDAPVMDAKGESIFRRRPIYWVLETITLRRMETGSIVDDIPARLAAAQTPLVVDERFPTSDWPFLDANYLPIGDRLHVAGKALGVLRAGATRRFDIAVAQTYAVVAPHGAAAGLLDGEPVAGPRVLAAGPHQFTAAADGAVALVWSPALSRGLRAELLFEEVRSSR